MDNPKIFDCFSRAWSTMQSLLFKPFRFRYWLVLGFVAWLASLGEGGGGNYSNFCKLDGNDIRALQEIFANEEENSDSVTDDESAEDADSIPVKVKKDEAKDTAEPENAAEVKDVSEYTDTCVSTPGNSAGIFHILNQICFGNLISIAVIAGIVILALIVVYILLLVWLRARGTFMLLDSLVHQDEISIKQRWVASHNAGNSLFVVNVLLTLGIFIVMIPTIAIIAICFYAVFTGGSMLATCGTIAIGALVLILLCVIIGIFMMCFNDFGSIYMYKTGVSASLALKKIWTLFRERKMAVFKYYIGMLLIQILLVVVAGAIFAIGCCLLCIPDLLMILPYTWAVLMLPMLVLRKYFTMFYAAKISEEFDIFLKDTPEADSVTTDAQTVESEVQP